MECPLWVISRRISCLPKRSALGGKADIIQGVPNCPLIAISGHLVIEKLRREPSSLGGGMEI